MERGCGFTTSCGSGQGKEQERHPSPSEGILDSQSVKSAAMVQQAVGYDAGKKIHRERFLTVDTLGLVLRVLVTAANVGEREEGLQVLNRVKHMGKSVSRLTTIWADGGFDGAPFLMWVMDVCRWTRASGAATGANPWVCGGEEARLWWSGPLVG